MCDHNQRVDMAQRGESGNVLDIDALMLPADGFVGGVLQDVCDPIAVGDLTAFLRVLALLSLHVDRDITHRKTRGATRIAQKCGLPLTLPLTHTSTSPIPEAAYPPYSNPPRSQSFYLALPLNQAVP